MSATITESTPLRQMWQEAVASGATERGFLAWREEFWAENERRYVVAKGSVDVYIYVDLVNDKVSHVVVDDDSLPSSQEMQFSYADKNHVVSAVWHALPDDAYAARLVMEKGLWPGWVFGW
jgi:hypothetical protein